jgi:hypothetical protein
MAGTSKGVDAKGYVVGALPVSALLAFNVFIVRHLVRLYAVFDGDLLEAIVLGEVAHHNLSAYLARATEAARSRTAQAPPLPDRSDYLPTNAFSIAQATGIPRQTVRRKVKALVARGWLLEDKAGLIVSPLPFQHFRQFNADLAADLQSTFSVAIKLTRSAERPAGAGRSRTRR